MVVVHGDPGGLLNRIHLTTALLTLCLATACQGGTGANADAARARADHAAAPTTTTASTATASSDAAGGPALPPPEMTDTAGTAPAGAGVPAADNAPSKPGAGQPPAAGDGAVESKAFAMTKGMTADIGPGATLSFERIVSDSRCPKDVQCIWAGEVTIAMRLKSSAGSDKFELSGKANSHTAQGRVIELVSYGPCPSGGPATTPLSGECATLSVTPAPAH
jgi:hypothetical protein